MPETPMIERATVAAIDEAKRQNADVWHDWCTDEEEGNVEHDARTGRHRWRIHSQHEPLDMLAIVKAVVLSMREPTEAMTPRDGVPAGIVDGCDHYLDREEARHAWAAMIDAALAEVQE